MCSTKKNRRADEFGDQQRGDGKGGIDHASLCDADSGVQYTPDSVRELVHDGEVWVEEHPGAWLAFCDYADECIRTGRPFAGNHLSKVLSDHDFEGRQKRDLVNHKTGEDASISRTLYAYLVRKLITEKPALRPLVHLRHSRFDPCFDWRIRELGIVLVNADQEPDEDEEPKDEEPPEQLTLDQLLDLVEVMREHPGATCADALDYWESLGDDEGVDA